MKARKPRTAAKPQATQSRFSPMLSYLLMGGSFGLAFIALLLIIQGQLTTAARWVLVAAVLAGWEYQLRSSVESTPMEDELSNLTDMFAFAIVPGFLIYQLVFRGWGMLGLVSLFVVVFGALIRLSFYKLYNPGVTQEALIGIPLTMSASLVALIGLLVNPLGILHEVRLLVFLGVVAVTFLNVSTIRYPNPAKHPWLLILTSVGVVGVWVPVLAEKFAWLLLFSGAVYILAAPVWVAERGGKNV